MKLLLKPAIKLKQNINLDAIKAYQKAVLAKYASNASEENMKADFSTLLRALGGFECEMDYASIDLGLFKSTPSKRQLKCIVETKRPFSTDFISEENANKKSLAQALYYYMQQQKKGESFISSLIITDFFTAFIFSEKPFLMLANRQSVKAAFRDYEGDKEGFYEKFKSLNLALELKCIKLELVRASPQESLNSGFSSDATTQATHATQEAAPKSPDTLNSSLPAEHANETQQKSKANQAALISSALSPHILFKEPLEKDANAMNEGFYAELLHIIGLKKITEIDIKKDKSLKDKKDQLVRSSVPNTLLDLIAPHLPCLDDAMRLATIWLNRILFLKLLEAKLRGFRGDEGFKILDDFTKLHVLFFSVLAVPMRERAYEGAYAHIPYLNSSLFEKDLLESECAISSLDASLLCPLSQNSVLKKSFPKKAPVLKYLLAFLDSYHFNESKKGVDESTIIRASVLGLIFERLNGYKDGSFYTPSFITMYMCDYAIKRQVLALFCEGFAKDFASFDELLAFARANFHKNELLLKAKNILSKFRLADISVGSGHFLVSALNALVHIHSQLGLLHPKVFTKIIQDELHVFYNDGEPFIYAQNKKGVVNETKQAIQKAVFMLKKEVIENNLFGVDLNPNSANICRLRLWIELLKHSFFKDAACLELEVLPNIDINIKVGNSLINLLPLKGKSTARNIQISVKDYQKAASLYKQGLGEKRLLREKVEHLKLALANFRPQNTSFKTLLKKLDDFIKTYSTHEGLSEQAVDINARYNGGSLFLDGPPLPPAARAKALRLNKICEDYLLVSKNALEFSVEFPEVLSDDGSFLGFDVLIGNPPYIQLQKMALDASLQGFYKEHYKSFDRRGDIYQLFLERSLKLLRPGGLSCQVTSNKYLRAGYGERTRALLSGLLGLECAPLELIDLGAARFDSATVDTAIISFIKAKSLQKSFTGFILGAKSEDLAGCKKAPLFIATGKEPFILLDNMQKAILDKLSLHPSLGELDVSINRGVLTGLNEAFIIDEAKQDELIALDPRSKEVIKPILRGRDIKRYGYEFAKLYLLATLPAMHLDIEQYPAIKAHLANYLPAIKQSGEKGCRKKTSNAWFETQDNIAYYEEFEKEKIVWNSVGAFEYSLIPKGAFLQDTNYFLTLPENDDLTLKYLLAVFNSKPFIFGMQFKDTALGTGGGYRHYKYNIENFPIPKPSKSTLPAKVDELLALKSCEANEENEDKIKALEEKIDAQVYSLYGLSEEEIAYIEKALKA